MYPFNFNPEKTFIDMQKVFVAMPFDDEFEDIYTELILPAICKVNMDKMLQLQPYRAKDPKRTRTGWIEILENLYTARIVIGVLTSDNANVFYELGIAHATQQINRQLLIAPEEYKPKFDMKDLIYIKYNPENLSSGRDNLASSIFDTLTTFDYENERSINKALSMLSTLEFTIISTYKDISHFNPTKLESEIEHESRINYQLGLAFLCQARMLRLSWKTIEKIGGEFSYYWTDLGNGVLLKMGLIDEDELTKRNIDYYKFFPNG